MIDEPKCPFCGKSDAGCEEIGISNHMWWCGDIDVNRYRRRSIEDALNAKIEQLRADVIYEQGKKATIFELLTNHAKRMRAQLAAAQARVEKIGRAWAIEHTELMDARKRLEELDWIPVVRRLPKHEGKYDVYTSRPNYGDGWIERDVGFSGCSFEGENDEYMVTHWKEHNQPPVGRKEE